jgi:hypothetical protein
VNLWFHGTDDGSWSTDERWLPTRGTWWMATTLSGGRQRLILEGATESHEGFRRALSEIVAQHSELGDLQIQFDGPPVLVSELLSRPPFAWETADFYHGTSIGVWEKVKRDALRPRSETGSGPAYGSQYSSAPKGREDAVYLSTQLGPAHFAARDASRPDHSMPVVLRVHGIREQYAIPDVDSRERTARDSLDRMGTIGYLRTIPASQITLFETLDRERGKWIKHDTRSNPGQPGWESTLEQVKETVEGYERDIKGRPWKFQRVPIKGIFWLDFTGDYDDPRGGPGYISELSDLMRQRVPLPPAVLYRRPGDRYWTARDGNHRIGAAVRLGMKDIPAITWRTAP